MQKIIVKQKFAYAIGGNDVVEFEPGEHEVDDDCAIVAVEQLKVAKLAKLAPPEKPEGAE
jgi:hypothetical protein